MAVVFNLFAASDKLLLFCGRRNLHLHSLEKDKVSKVTTLELTGLLSDAEKLHLDKIAVVCCNISPCSNYVIVADSEKNVFMFKRNDENWKHHSSWKMEKRIIKVHFDIYSTTIILTDKTGDVYVCFVESSTVSAPNKVLGHCSLILDTVVTEDNTQIYTSDRDEKIRVSVFPDGFEIINFLLGHREAVVNISLAKQDSLLVSASCDGVLKAWNRADGKCIGTWSIFEMINDYPDVVKPSDFELLRMRITDNTFLTFGYVAIIIRKDPHVHIFKINFGTLNISLCGKVKKDSDFCDTTWVKQNLYVFTPESVGIEKYACNDNGVIPALEFQCPLSEPEKTDIRGYQAFHKDYVSLKKLAWVDKSKPVDYDSNKYGISKLSRLQSLELDIDNSTNAGKTERDVS